MNFDSENWVTESYIRMQDRIASRLVAIAPADSSRQRHEVSLYGALSGLRQKLHERALHLREDRNSLAPASILGSGQANIDRTQAQHGGEGNRPCAQRNKGRGNRGRRSCEEVTLTSSEKDAFKKHLYCIQKLRLVRRAVLILSEREVHQDGTQLGVPSLGNKVNAFGAARWLKVPWTRGTTNRTLQLRMGAALYELCFEQSPIVRLRAEELGYETPLTWGRMCIVNRINFALKDLRLSWSSQ